MCWLRIERLHSWCCRGPICQGVNVLPVTLQQRNQELDDQINVLDESVIFFIWNSYSSGQQTREVATLVQTGTEEALKPSGLSGLEIHELDVLCFGFITVTSMDTLYAPSWSWDMHQYDSAAARRRSACPSVNRSSSVRFATHPVRRNCASWYRTRKIHVEFGKDTVEGGEFSADPRNYAAQTR